MCVHPVRACLDQDRAIAGAALAQRPASDGQGSQHVVAIHPDPGKAVAAGPLIQRYPGLAIQRCGDRPLVVLAEEDHRCVVDGGPDEALVHIALRGGAVTEETDRGLRVLGVADLSIQPLSHCVAGGVQALVGDHDGVKLEAGADRIPRALIDAAEDAEDLGGIHSTAPRNAVLAVGREGHVLRGHRATGTDLGGLLTQQRRPQTELALALQGFGLPIGPADQHHVAIQRLQLRGGDLQAELRVRDPLPLGGQPLLQPEPGLHASDVVAEYQRALATGDLDAILATFDPDGFMREPAGGAYVHRGTDEGTRWPNRPRNGHGSGVRRAGIAGWHRHLLHPQSWHGYSRSLHSTDLGRRRGSVLASLV